MRHDLHECLVFYHTDIEPAKISLTNTLTELVKVLKKIYRNSGHLSPEELHLLKEWMLGLIDHVFNLAYSSEVIDAEVKNVFQDLEGTSYEKIVEEQIDSL